MNKIISAAMVMSVIALATSCSETKIDDSSVSEVVTTTEISETEEIVMTSEETISEVPVIETTAAETTKIEIDSALYDMFCHVAGNYIHYDVETRAKVIACIVNKAESEGVSVYSIINEKELDVTSIRYGDDVHYSELSDAVAVFEEHRNEWDFTDWTENDGEIDFK